MRDPDHTDAAQEPGTIGAVPSYAQLLETNNLIQQCVDESYWLCVTRTVQESKLFPVPSYMLLSYLMAFYRYPALLRKIEARMPAEEIGDRARNMGIKIQNPAVGWGLPCFYLLGREWLMNMGLLRPTDAVDDIVYVMDFWKRFLLAWKRNDGHLTNTQFGHRAQVLTERRLQMFHANLYDCAPGDDLHTAAHAFMAAASQYGFLISCESRISLHNSGPYKLDDSHELLVRDFMDLAESDFPWLDEVAADMPYNNLTVTMAVKDCHFYLVDDWGSFESQPEFRSENLAAVGLYTSDILSDGHVPVGMGSREELISTFNRLTEQVKDATAKLWKRIANWSRDQMIDAGAITYFAIVKDLSHVAGVYEMEDWMLVDRRAERFRPLLNDEYSRDVLGELVGLVSLPTQQIQDYAMMQHANAPKRMYSHIPYAILSGEPFTLSVGGLAPGHSVLPRKQDRYRTTQGVLDLAGLNERARAFKPSAQSADVRFLCDTWVKYHHDTETAERMYAAEQAAAPALAGQGAGLRRDAIAVLRARHRG
ncbi:MAG: hypothetical protein ACFB22_09040 [Rhodothalassiaceae bacterium]